MPRRKRADSITAAVEAATAPQIQPPSNVPLTGSEMVFFANVIAEAARSEWTAHQLEVAAMLARAMEALNSEQQLLRTEGYVITNDGGRAVTNPRANVAKSLVSDILSMRRSLQIHARAKNGEARDTAKRTAILKEAEGNDPSDLLARPN